MIKLHAPRFTLFFSRQVLEVLWELAHRPHQSTVLIEEALEHHLGVLNDSYTVKETVKKSYVIKCVDDIKKVSI